jgi:hypothetical protein
MATTTAFHSQRQDLTRAFAKYDDLVANGADTSALATAEHQIYLASKALTTQLTAPGVFVLNLVFQVCVRVFVPFPGRTSSSS